jgi:hypothetical protein
MLLNDVGLTAQVCGDKQDEELPLKIFQPDRSELGNDHIVELWNG